MINKNKFIQDDGKVRFCRSNIAKMTLWEYCYLELTDRNILGYTLKESLNNAVEGIKYLTFCFCELFSILLFPIALPIVAQKAIKQEKNNLKSKLHQKITER
ncbi:hypothetical protein [Paenibacillus sp. FSL H3-0333]|uniref:hypothetical protein n=1 Tax=Paenibacillus sp. FSL H3-0333 TaxID=2921373 RepID=UPI0030F843C3